MDLWKQVRCRDASLCNSAGLRVVLTDFHRSNRADLLLGEPAFGALAKPGMAHRLKSLDTISVEYKRYEKIRETQVEYCGRYSYLFFTL
jgi:hypothetical protein